jgi:hypothetical protein
MTDKEQQAKQIAQGIASLIVIGVIVSIPTLVVIAIVSVVLSLWK